MGLQIAVKFLGTAPTCCVQEHMRSANLHISSLREPGYIISKLLSVEMETMCKSFDEFCSMYTVEVIICRSVKMF